MDHKEFDTLLNAVCDPVMIISPDHKIITVNAAAIKASGLAEDELVGRNCHEIFHHTKSPPANCPLEKVKSSLRKESERVEMEAPDGTFQVSVSPVLNENGQLLKAVHISNDCSECHISDSEAEKRFHHCFDLANIGFALTSPGKGWLHVNQHLCMMLGYTEEELLKKTWSEMTFPDDLQADEEEFNNVLAGKISRYETDKRFYRSDGKLIYMHVTVSCIRNDDGSVNFLFTTLEDVTERKMTENALWESEERFRTMMEQSPISIQIMDPDGHTIAVNRAWEELWGISMDDLKDYSMLKDRQLEVLGIMKYIKRGFAGETVFIPAVEYDVQKTVGKGRSRWVQAHIYPVKDGKGNIRNVVLMHEDITERRLAEDEIKVKVKELEEFYEMSIGRELKMKELKQSIRTLTKKLSRYEKEASESS